MMERHELRLVQDLAIHAASEALDAIVRIADTAPAGSRYEEADLRSLVLDAALFIVGNTAIDYAKKARSHE